MTSPAPGLVRLAVTLRCHVCGEVPCATWEEADKRAEQHVKVTGHPTAVEVVRVP